MGGDYSILIGGDANYYQRQASMEDYKKKIKVGFRELPKIRLCRIPVFGSPGHHWVEIVHDDENTAGPNGYRESYGWYPAVSGMDVEGCVNGDSPYRKGKDASKILSCKSSRNAGRRLSPNEISSRAFDPHQCDHHIKGKIDHVISPYLLPDDHRSQDDIISEIREFAKIYKTTYSTNWSYYWTRAYDENNCHNFLILLLCHVRLADVHIGRGKEKYFNAYYKSVQNNISEPGMQSLFKQLDELNKRCIQAKKNYDLLDK